ncbi:MAG: hypothetical protein H7256_07730 [Bdellovibrio sp.]|nr:hypothetical protein [Bdellovibrio sp.]
MRNGSLFWTSHEPLAGTIPPESMPKLIEKRRSAFLKLFQNDFDLYTKKEIIRDVCLKKVEADSVQFLSGLKMLWADCRSAGNKTGHSMT